MIAGRLCIGCCRSLITVLTRPGTMMTTLRHPRCRMPALALPTVQCQSFGSCRSASDESDVSGTFKAGHRGVKRPRGWLSLQVEKGQFSSLSYLIMYDPLPGSKGKKICLFPSPGGFMLEMPNHRCSKVRVSGGGARKRKSRGGGGSEEGSKTTEQSSFLHCGRCSQ